MKPARSIRLWLPPAAALPWVRVPGVSAFALAAIVFVVALGGVLACGSSGDGGSGDSNCGAGECKILASDGRDIDTFGFSVAIAGDVIVVGAASDDTGDRSGSAYVYRFDGTDWVEEQKLTASDASTNQQFGISVAVSGDLIVVGAQLDDDNGNTAGAAYIYRFDGASWVQERKLLTSDGATGDLFGIAVAIAGNAIVVGAFRDDDSGNESGSAYVFRFDGANWIEEDKLTASDGAAFQFFGISVAITADVIVIGADLDGENGLFAGAAYVYRFDGADWIEEQKLTSSDGVSGDLFGISVAIAGDVVVVGAYLDDVVGKNSGSAYVYRHDGAAWVEEDKLTNSDGAPEDFFGINVALDADLIVVGADLDDDDGSRSGSAYAYRYNGVKWIEERKITASDANAGDFFGISVALAGDMLVVGAYLDDDRGIDSGSAYVYELEP